MKINRKKKILTINRRPTPTHNVGGYLPYPPKYCLKKEMWRKFHGTLWIDLGCCFTCPELSSCKRRKEYLAEGKAKRKENPLTEETVKEEKKPKPVK